ncbi:MAG: DUF6946 family protein [Gaiellaceae bacterium]
MSKFFVSGDSAEGWRIGLTKQSHWKPRHSAHSLAHSWHEAGDWPPSVERALAASELGPLELIAGIPEYKVALPGGDTASQTDLFVLARTQGGRSVAMAVEGKAREPFGDTTVDVWSLGASIGKQKRLAFLKRVLSISDNAALGETRYQLLHRAASPVIEAERLHADHAVMLVHSFHEPGEDPVWFDEFAKFAALLGAEARMNGVFRAEAVPRSLYLGWVSDLHPEVGA